MNLCKMFILYVYDVLNLASPKANPNHKKHKTQNTKITHTTHRETEREVEERGEYNKF
jgi:hypothetical protein